jgi:hypothetical protein
VKMIRQALMDTAFGKIMALLVGAIVAARSGAGTSRRWRSRVRLYQRGMPAVARAALQPTQN